MSEGLQHQDNARLHHEILQRLTRIEGKIETALALSTSNDKRIDKLEQFRLVVIVVAIALSVLASFVTGGNIAWAVDVIGNLK